MKKTILLGLVATATLSVNAQNVKLEVGKTIKNAVGSEIEMNVGMPMTMKNATDFDINVVKDDGKTYLVTVKKTRIQTEVNAMGNSQKTDTNDKSTLEGEGAEMITKQLEVIDSFSVNKETGEGTKLNKTPSNIDNGDSNPFSKFSPDENGLNGIFLVIPQGKNVGDTWEKNVDKDGAKLKTVYTIKSIEAGVATIALVVTGNVVKNIEANGSEITMDMNTNGKTTMTIDVKTSIVKSTKNTTDIEGSMTIMGQNMPVTMTVNGTNEVK
jgi:hypothetical protein